MRGRTWEALLGLVVLGLVLGGVFWVRGRGGAARPAGSAGAPAAEVPPDLTGQDRNVDLGDVRIVLAVAPRPLVAFAEHRFRVRAESGGAAVAIGEARLSFEMTMPMGDHRYTLVPAADGWQEAVVVLPACPSGGRRWFATVEGTVAGRPRSARFQLELSPPAGGTAP